MTIKTFVLVTGYSGAGKSSTIELIKAYLNAHVITGDEAISRVSQENGFEDNLDYLNKVGVAALTATASRYLLDRIAERVEKQQFQAIVIDSVYDPNMRALLQEQYPTSQVLLVHLSAPWEIRLERLQKRLGWSQEYAKERLKLIDDLKEEAGVQQMAESADVRIVNAGEDPDALAKEVRERVLPVISG